MNERVLEVMRHYDLSQAEFADALEVTRGQISHISSGRNKPGVEFLVKVLETFPDVSSDWLLMGAGPMLRSGSPGRVKASHDSTPAEVGRSPETKAAGVEQPGVSSPIKKSDAAAENVLQQSQGLPLQALTRPGIKRLTIYYDDNTYEDLRIER